MSPYADRLRTVWPWSVVVAFSSWLLWPVCIGTMPLSADHTVHVTRIRLWADELAQGHVRGWSAAWFFGTPVGELYPVLGDLVVVLVRAITFGALGWPTAYALGLTIVFTLQGVAMLAIGRRLGAGPWPGVVAGVLVLADAGAYREGGWTYTMVYGVWPQALAAALSWWGLVELAHACTQRELVAVRRATAGGAVLLGAALLAHPMALPTMAMGVPMLVAVVGLRALSDESRRTALRRTIVTATIGSLWALALAAWWVLPMLEHRGWMASYGWLWQPLEAMGRAALRGEITQNMPGAVAIAIALGLGLAAVAGNTLVRLVAAFAVVQWLFASRDPLWDLRLDLVSSGFAHVQFQRFLIVAKPGLMLVAGWGIGRLLQWAAAAWKDAGRARVLAIGLAGSVAALLLAMAVGTRERMREHDVGRIALAHTDIGGPSDADHAALAQWLSERWAERGDAWWRVTVRARRNDHWFMDLPALTGVPLYKQGFTPGDNFVHKPEAGTPMLLDRLRVRWEIGRGQRAPRDATLSFGELWIRERAGWDTPVAWLADAPEGTVEVLADDVEAGDVRVRVAGVPDEATLVFAIAGYPRWQLEQDGEPIPWFEVPVYGDGPPVVPDERRAGLWRGGKALGDDGTEATLLAARVRDGELVLRYRARRAGDLGLGVLAWLALAATIAALRPGPRPRLDRALATIQRALGPLGHPLVPLVIATALLAVAVHRVHAGRQSEAQRLVGQVEQGRARIQGARVAHFKTDMTIVPAVIRRARIDRPTVVELDVHVPEVLQGWVALDDDAAQMPRKGEHTLMLEIGGEVVHEHAVRHVPGRQHLSVPTGAHAGGEATLRITITSQGSEPPPVAFDFELPP